MCIVYRIRIWTTYIAAYATLTHRPYNFLTLATQCIRIVYISNIQSVVWQKMTWCHEINSHKINCHQINSHEINSHGINLQRDWNKDKMFLTIDVELGLTTYQRTLNLSYCHNVSLATNLYLSKPNPGRSSACDCTCVLTRIDHSWLSHHYHAPAYAKFAHKFLTLFHRPCATYL